MSRSQFCVNALFQPGKLTEAILNDFLRFVLKSYDYEGDYNGTNSEHDAIGNIISDTFRKCIETKSSINSDYINFGWFEIAFCLSDNYDSISILLNLDRLNPDEEIGHRIGNKILKLTDIYVRAEFLISCSKYFWVNIEGGKYVHGDWLEKLAQLEKKEGKNGPVWHERLINPRDFLGCFWLNIIPDNQSVSKGFADLPFYGKKPEFKHQWYRKEKLVNGTLLVKSRLPLVAINETTESVDWERLEKHWRQLEKERGL